MSGEKLTLEIATPERLVVTEGVDEVVLPSVQGYMGVRIGHAPLLARLQVGQISYRIGGEERVLATSGGFAEVLRDGVQVLARTCEPVEEIDLSRAERAKERAESRLREKHPDTDFDRAEVALERAVCRIQAAGRRGGR